MLNSQSTKENMVEHPLHLTAFFGGKRTTLVRYTNRQSGEVSYHEVGPPTPSEVRFIEKANKLFPLEENDGRVGSQLAYHLSCIMHLMSLKDEVYEGSQEIDSDTTDMLVQEINRLTAITTCSLKDIIAFNDKVLSRLYSHANDLAMEAARVAHQSPDEALVILARVREIHAQVYALNAIREVYRKESWGMIGQIVDPDGKFFPHLDTIIEKSFMNTIWQRDPFS